MSKFRYTSKTNFSHRFSILFIFGVTFITAGCNSPIAQRAQNSDGFLGFIFNYPGPNILPVEHVSSWTGKIVSAHATADRGGLLVSGLVGKTSRPPYGSYIDVIIMDANKQTIAATKTNYFPAEIPDRFRGSMGYSHYFARFPFIPAPGSLVKVIFHENTSASQGFWRTP
jgi:hypothetical protein